uniref:Uncharacterized protein n=1 Tax=Chromera velia CCMP2878 TaxID=1169474 RepID=A0A0G4HTD3_9ALVE|eukprot:Cvel_8461.t1-p1 / transcript=Cvel_8461.t1 / gene=Cvel_8461 / organism=Chromera_velia_CCMP2878 / gene_product=hypothetical protein / transcript_product=hypothetical protein / location=Cvel_scaffold467:59470-60829(+) / protein_length=351 / sequence_SO=supercontig / SO=protein_coding / is_pseudo=false
MSMIHLCEMGLRRVRYLYSRDELMAQDFIDIASGIIEAVVVRNFVEDKICLQASERLVDIAERTPETSGTPGVKRLLGQCFSDTKGNHRARSFYVEYAIAEHARIQHIFAPYTCPPDSLIALLSEKFPSGASLISTKDGRKLSSGIVQQLNGDVLGHENKLERDANPEDFPEDFYGASQIAGHVYVDVPLVGGELILWKKSLDQQTYDSMRGDSHGISFPSIGLPEVVLKPQRGDLILFNSRNLHATRGVPTLPKVEEVEEDEDEEYEDEESDDEDMDEEAELRIINGGQGPACDQLSTTACSETARRGKFATPPLAPIRTVRKAPSLGNSLALSTFILLRDPCKPILFWS